MEGVEAMAVGREGLVGMPLLLGSEQAELHAMVRIPGTALRLSAAAWTEGAERLPGLRILLNHYILIRHVQATQIAACTGRHSISQPPGPDAADGPGPCRRRHLPDDA